MYLNLLTVQPDFSAIPGIHAKQTAGNLRSPGSHQAGKPQHLTLTYLKADRFKNTVSLQILHLQDDLSRFQVLPVEDIFDFPAYHQFRQLVLIGLTIGVSLPVHHPRSTVSLSATSKSQDICGK